MLELLQDPQTYVSLISLSLLEIVLGIDNIIFLSIIVNKLPPEFRNRARIFGLLVAIIGRLVLLLSIAWLARLTQPLFTIGTLDFSGKDLVLLGGGLFLLYRSAREMYEETEEPNADKAALQAGKATFFNVIMQIVLIDMVFSLDSIITAVGLVSEIPIMVGAVFIALGIMIVASAGISGFIERHPSIKTLALSFLLMIGTVLVAEGFGVEIPRGYIYFSLTFALFVEWINIKTGKRVPS